MTNPFARIGHHIAALVAVSILTVSTLNLAHMMPLSAVWAGPERDEHFGAPPLFFAKTEGSIPFGFPFTSAMSATRSWSGRPAPARACCLR